MSSVFGSEGKPSSRELISVHLRFGDKTEMEQKAEMEPLPIPKYVEAVKRLVEQRNISRPAIYVASEGKARHSAGLLTDSVAGELGYH